ncbi:MAG TPA: hypothetical protein VHI98_09435, partial [Vicinamibacterales bacterium]|nr:hypothetical protein [Vicinamibacterales bacterium]
RSRSQYRTSRQNDAPGAHRDAHIGTYALVVFDTPIAGSALGSTSGCGSFCATLGEHGKRRTGIMRCDRGIGS